MLVGTLFQLHASVTSHKEAPSLKETLIFIYHFWSTPWPLIPVWSQTEVPQSSRIHTYGHTYGHSYLWPFWGLTGGPPFQEQGLTRSCWRRGLLHTKGQLAFLHHGLSSPMHPETLKEITYDLSPRVERKHHWSMCHSMFYVDTKKFQMVVLTWSWLIIPIFLYTLAKIAYVVTVDEAEAMRESLEASTHRWPEGWHSPMSNNRTRAKNMVLGAAEARLSVLLQSAYEKPWHYE